jgi:hypothetical protein
VETVEKGLGLEICTRCNLHCADCNRWTDMQDYTMSFEEVDHLISTTKGRVRFKWAMIGGGEPTLHPDVNRIITGLAAAEVAELGITVLTNGIAIRNLEPAASTGAIARIRLSVYPATRALLEPVEAFCRRFGVALVVRDKTHMRDTTTAPTAEQIAASFADCYGHLLMVRGGRAYPCCEGGAVAMLRGIGHGLAIEGAWWRDFDTPRFRTSVRELLCPHCSHPLPATVPWRRHSSAALAKLPGARREGRAK